MNRNIGVMTACLLMQGAAIQGQQPQEPPKASMQGAVLKIGTDEPIIGAHVTLIRTSAPSPGISAPSELVTDGSGKFAFKDIEPGTYRVSVAGNGFVKQDYGQRVNGAPGSIVTLSAGQTTKDIVVHLTPTGSISGTVRDSAGQPMVGVAVLLLRPAYNATGSRTFQSAGSGRTDDRGQYRAYLVTPGRYYVRAALSTVGVRSADQGGPPASPNEVTTSYAPTFYPGVGDINNAVLVDVAPGQEIRAIDFALQSAGPFTVRGKVVDPRGGQTLSSVSVALASQSIINGSVTASFTTGTAGNNRYFASTGTFEFRGLSPGTYGIGITASTQGPSTTRPVAFAKVVISNSDVDGVVLNLVSPVSAPGRIRIEDQDFSAVAGAERINLQFRPFGDQLAPSAGGVRVVQSQQANPPNGMLNIDGLVPGDYQVSATGLPSQDYYAKEIRFDGADVLSHPLHFVPGARGGFEILLSAKAARLTGSVSAENLQPAANAQVVLAPDDRDRIDLYRTVTADKTGHFSLSGVPPGNYRLFAWEAIEPYAYFDPEFHKPAESQGKAIKIDLVTSYNGDL